MLKKRSNIIILSLTVSVAILVILWIISPNRNWEPWATLIGTVAIPIVIMFKDAIDGGNKKPIEKADLNIELKSAQIKYSGYAGSYYAQLNINMISHHFSSSLHSVFVRKNGTHQSASELDPYSTKGKPINEFYSLASDQLHTDLGDFIKKEVNNENRHKINSLELIQDRVYKYSILPLIESERYSDGHEDLILTDWRLIINYNLDKFIEVPFDFTIHSSSPQRPVKYEAEGFKLP